MISQYAISAWAARSHLGAEQCALLQVPDLRETTSSQWPYYRRARGRFRGTEDMWGQSIHASSSKSWTCEDSLRAIWAQFVRQKCPRGYGMNVAPLRRRRISNL